MKRLKGLAALLISLAQLAGCAAAPAKEEREEGAFVAHGYLRGGASVAQLDGALYAFLPKGEGPGAREYLYELNEDGGKGRIVCGKAGCAHEEQGTLLDPCHAYSHTVTGLMAADGALFAGSRNGAVGVTRFDPKGGPPETVLTSEKEIACFLVWDGDIYYAQQDQPFPAGELTQGGGYRLMKRPLDAPDAPAEAIYAREGRGYIGCCQQIGGALYLTEFALGDGGEEMNIVRVSPEGGDAAVFAPNCGGHFIAQVGKRLGVARRNGDGTWTALLLDHDGGNAIEAETTQAPCQVAGAGGNLLVDSGIALPAGGRTLTAYSEAGERLGSMVIPASYSAILGADETCAYYWDEATGAAPRLIRVGIKGFAP